jgi:hypothetical protein
MSEVDRPPDTPTADNPGKGSGSDEERDWVELFSTILMALAAVLTAWAGFQAAKWGGVQATAFSEAGANRTESTRASGLANEQRSVDVDTWLNWSTLAVTDLEADRIPDPAAEGGYSPTPGTLSGFMYERFRPEFEPVVQAWIATMPFTDADAPETPFAMPEYELAADVEAQELLEVAEASAADAREANQDSDNYVVTTIMAALVLFFAGLAGKLSLRRNQYIALGLGVFFFLGTLIRVFTLPIEI